jgi:hypothetical protein
MWSYEKNVGRGAGDKTSNVIYYDYMKTPKLNGWSVRNECKSCRCGSFNSGCTCEYTYYMPDPLSIPVEIIEAEKTRVANEKLKVLIEKDLKNIYINLRKVTHIVFAKARYNMALNSKTLNELLWLRFSLAKYTKRIISGNKTWVIVRAPEEYRVIPDLKVILGREVKRFTGNEKIERIYS